MGIMSFLDDVTKALQDFGDSITSNLSGSVDNNIQETVHGTDTLGIINASHIESAISTSDIIGQSPLTGTVGQTLIPDTEGQSSLTGIAGQALISDTEGQSSLTGTAGQALIPDTEEYTVTGINLKKVD